MRHYEEGPADMLEHELGAEEQIEEHGTESAAGSRLSSFRERITTALAGLDRGRIDQLGLDSGAHFADEDDLVGALTDDPAFDDDGLPLPGHYGPPTQPVHAQATMLEATVPEPEFEPEPSERPETGAVSEPTPFPVGRMGYNRAAVDARIAELEAELTELRAMPPQPSINDEIQRLGEQTASILVVAHDQATETTRRATEKADEMTRTATAEAQEMTRTATAEAEQMTREAREQADRRVADAAAQAAEMTAKAKRRLGELDEETDAVWRERLRLLEDARTVGGALIALADEAAERFPAEGKPEATASPAGGPVPSAPGFPPPVPGF